MRPPTATGAAGSAGAQGGAAGEAGAAGGSGGGTGGAGAPGGAGAQAGAGGAAGGPSCDGAAQPLTDGLLTLQHAEGDATHVVVEQPWSVEVNGSTYALAEGRRWEATRFDLEHPARVHAFSVQWARVPADPSAALEAGLYPDFGLNGFDFGRTRPLWVGTRCAAAAAPGAWVTYVLETPVELKHPGPIFVAHLVESADGPAFPFTKAGAETTCEAFDACHSAINLPDAEKGTFFDGLSLSLPHDFAVRLHLEYVDQVPPEQRYFTKVDQAAKSHVSFGDFDDDGFDDVFAEGPSLLRNLGDGTFADVTADAGIVAPGATGGVWGDFDNDGCLDLFAYAESYAQPDVLFRSNCDGTFTDVTAAAGIVDQQTVENCGDPANKRSPTAAAAWVDLDADGLLDLYLANFICWDKGKYYKDTIYHNKGGGQFENWSGTHGFSNLNTASRGVAPIDHDLDGDVDLLVNNYRLQANFFFDNQGDGTVKERAKLVGLAGTKKQGSPYYGHTIGVAWGDVDNDGDFDQIAANLAHPRFFGFSDKTQVLLQNPDHTFTDVAGDWSTFESKAGLRYQETHSVPALADFDADGNLDLVITAVYDGRPTDFYRGNGDGSFTLDAYRAGITTTNGWGVATADLDHDGDLDVFAHTPFLNSMPQAGHWLQIKIVGNAGCNRAAIGAVARVTSNGATRLRQVQGGTGQGNQDSAFLHFGLGEAASVEKIEVSFPGGKSVSFSGPFGVDRRLWLYEDGSSKEGWKP